MYGVHGRPLRGRIMTGAAALVGATAVALGVAGATRAWFSTKYLDSQSLCAHCEVYAGYTASREWNKVWRPTPRHFCLEYIPGSCVYDTWSNPFVDNRNAFNADAGCWNDDPNSSYPTTCMTTVP